MTRKSFLAVLMIALFSLFSVTAFAEGAPTPAENAEHLKQAIEHAEAAHAAVDAGDANVLAEHLKLASASLKEINASDAIAAKLRESRKLLRNAWIAVKKSTRKGGEPVGVTVKEEIERAIEDMKAMSK